MEAIHFSQSLQCVRLWLHCLSGLITIPLFVIGDVKSGACEPNNVITGILRYAAKWPAIESGATKHFWFANHDLNSTKVPLKISTFRSFTWWINSFESLISTITILALFERRSIKSTQYFNGHALLWSVDPGWMTMAPSLLKTFFLS